MKIHRLLEHGIKTTGR